MPNLPQKATDEDNIAVAVTKITADRGLYVHSHHRSSKTPGRACSWMELDFAIDRTACMPPKARHAVTEKSDFRDRDSSRRTLTVSDYERYQSTKTSTTSLDMDCNDQKSVTSTSCSSSTFEDETDQNKDEDDVLSHVLAIRDDTIHTDCNVPLTDSTLHSTIHSKGYSTHSKVTSGSENESLSDCDSFAGDAQDFAPKDGRRKRVTRTRRTTGINKEDVDDIVAIDCNTSRDGTPKNDGSRRRSRRSVKSKLPSMNVARQRRSPKQGSESRKSRDKTQGRIVSESHQNGRSVQSLRKKKTSSHYSDGSGRRNADGSNRSERAADIIENREPRRVRSKSSSIREHRTRSKSIPATHRPNENGDGGRRRKKKEVIRTGSISPHHNVTKDCTSKSCPNTGETIVDLDDQSLRESSSRSVGKSISASKQIRKRRKDLVKEKGKLERDEELHCRDRSRIDAHRVEQRTTSKMVGATFSIGRKEREKPRRSGSCSSIRLHDDTSSSRRSRSAHLRLTPDACSPRETKVYASTSLRRSRSSVPKDSSYHRHSKDERTTIRQSKTMDEKLPKGSGPLSEDSGHSYVTDGLKKLKKSFHERQASAAVNHSGEIVISPARAKSHIEKRTLIQNGGLATGISHGAGSKPVRNALRGFRDRALTRAKSIHNFTTSVQATGIHPVSRTNSFLTSRKEKQKMMIDVEHQMGHAQRSLYARIGDDSANFDDSAIFSITSLAQSSDQPSPDQIRIPPRRLKSLPIGEIYP